MFPENETLLQIVCSFYVKTIKTKLEADKIKEQKKKTLVDKKKIHNYGGKKKSLS